MAAVAPVSANPGQIWASDGNFDFKDIFGTNDAVYVTGTTDKTGEDGIFATSDVYVTYNREWQEGDAPADVTPGGHNTIQGGFAGQFFDQIVWLPPLHDGKYDLFMDQDRDGVYKASIDVVAGAGTDYAFEVRNSTAPPTVDKSSIKQDAAAKALHYKRDPEMLKYSLTAISSAQTAYKWVGAGWSPVTGILVGVGIGAYGLIDPNFAVGYDGAVRKIGLGIIRNLCVPLHDHYDALAKDPADPNFQEIVALGPIEAYSLLEAGNFSHAQTNLTNSLAKQEAIVVALTRSLEKLEGAQNAGNAEYVLLQAQAVKDYSDMMGANSQETINALAAYANEVANNNGNTVIRADEIRAWQQRLATTGLEPAEIHGMQVAGLTDAEIESFLSWVVNLNTSELTDFNEYLVWKELEAIYANQSLPACQALSADVADIIAYYKPTVQSHHPVANPGGPYAGLAEMPVSLNGTGSSDPDGQALTYAWDLDGDGDFDDATGATAEGLWQTEFSGHVGLKVTDTTGLSHVSYARVTVIPVNHPPVITEQSPASSGVKAAEGDSLTFSVQASDADGDNLTYAWKLDGALVATDPAWTHSAEAADMGKEVAVTVSDGKPYSLNATRLWRIVQKTQEMPVLTSIAVMPSNASITIGSTLQLNATAYDQFSIPLMGVSFVWESSNPGVATVDASGLVTAHNVGSAMVTATNGTIQGISEITVANASLILTTIDVAPANATITSGSTQQLNATAYDQFNMPMTGISFVWESSNPGVATVDASGLVTAHNVGSAMVTATNGTIQGISEITVENAPSMLTTIEIQPSTATVHTGKSRQFSAVARDQYGYILPGIEFLWQSSDTAVGTVDQNGLFHALAAGNTTLLAVNDSAAGTASVTVDVLQPTTVSAFTTDTQFDLGDASGVEHDTVHDQLQLSERMTTLPFIWVPNTGQGTVSKVDTETGKELGRYRVAPMQSCSPSRTTVDLEGNCYVGNRQAGTVVKIGLLEAGAWIDRNGNGVADTSRDQNGNGIIDATELLPWGHDECVLYEIVLIPGSIGCYAPGMFTGSYDSNYWGVSPRGLAVDADNNIWIGTWSTRKFFEIDGKTGQVIKTIDTASSGLGSYGAVVDGNGMLWSASLEGNAVLKIDPATGSFTKIPIGHYSYGLGLDYQGHLFVAGWEHRKLTRITINGSTVDWTVAGPYGARGIAVTADNTLWVASSHEGKVYRYDTGGAYLGDIPGFNHPTGVAVDAAGKVWVTDLNDDYIKRIDPATNAIDLSKNIDGAGGHYTYSDMTGILARTITTKIGTWSVVHDSQKADTLWGTITWNASTPAGTSFTVNVRSSPDGTAWSAPEAAVNDQPLQSTPKGRFLQVEARLQTNANEISPILYDLAIAPSHGTKIPLSIIAENKSKVYGAALPTFTVAYTGFVDGDDEQDLGGNLSVTTIANASSGVGTYPIIASGQTSEKYEIAYVPGTLTVTEAPLTIKAEDKTKQYSDPLPAWSASYDGFALGDGPSVLNGTLNCTTPASAMSGPGIYNITPSGLSAKNYAIAFKDGNLTVTAEDARVVYDGPLSVPTSSVNSNTATVTLRAIIHDITAMTEDPACDPFAGDIRNATVTFIDRNNGEVLCTSPVVLLDPSDTKKGIASCVWTADIGSSDSRQFTVGTIVNNFYMRDSRSEDVTITVSKAGGTGSAMGCGYLVLSKSAGSKAGDVGSRSTIAFNVKYYKGGSSLLGTIKLIIRRTEPDRRVHTYQVLSKSITNLAVTAAANPSMSTPSTAICHGEATVMDITNSQAPITIDAKAAIQMAMTDRGESGSQDTIGITVWRKDGGLLFSSNWSGTKTEEQNLMGGDLEVH